MFESPTPQHDLRQAKEDSRRLYDNLESAAARRSQLGYKRPTLRDRVRRGYRWITRQKPV